MFLEEALEVLRRVLPDDHPDVDGCRAVIAPNVSFAVMCPVSGGHMHIIASILR